MEIVCIRHHDNARDCHYCGNYLSNRMERSREKNYVFTSQIKLLKPLEAAKYFLKTNYLFCHQCLHLRRVSAKETSLLTPQA